jgi:CRP-like cAMP-binding protein
MTERTFEDGTIVCRAGEPAGAAYRVRSGALTVRPDDGGTPTLLLAGDVFGTEALLAGGCYAAEATARGRTVVEVVGRDAMIAALRRRPDAVLSLVRAALEADAAAPLDLDGASRAYRLVPMSDMLAEQIGADGVLVATFPFVVGRMESRRGENGGRGVDLVLRDRQPYNLSRRHFAIERRDAACVVRDCDSHHGTHVNGIRIGAGAASMAAELRPGDNLIVAGTAASPIRFSFLVG